MAHMVTVCAGRLPEGRGHGDHAFLLHAAGLGAVAAAHPAGERQVERAAIEARQLARRAATG